MRKLLVLFLLHVFVVFGGVSFAFAADKFLSLELNKLEAFEKGCRISFVVKNQLGETLNKTAIELVVFDDQQLISQMVLLDLGRFVPDKTRAIQFDLPQPCDKISRLLINDFTQCALDTAPREACLSSLRASTRSKVEFGS